MVGVPDTHLLQIGRMTVNFGMLESGLKHIIYETLGGQHMGQVVVADTNFKALTDLTNSLFIQYCRHQPLRDELWNILHGSVQEARTRRNKIMHATWGTQWPKIIMNTVKATKKTGFITEDVEITEEYLSDSADLIANAAYELQQFRLKLKELQSS